MWLIPFASQILNLIFRKVFGILLRENFRNSISRFWPRINLDLDLLFLLIRFFVCICNVEINSVNVSLIAPDVKNIFSFDFRKFNFGANWWHRENKCESFFKIFIISSSKIFLQSKDSPTSKRILSLHASNFTSQIVKLEPLSLLH